jgi:hypothetical protein
LVKQVQSVQVVLTMTVRSGKRNIVVGAFVRHVGRGLAAVAWQNSKFATVKKSQEEGKDCRSGARTEKANLKRDGGDNALEVVSKSQS